MMKKIIHLYKVYLSLLNHGLSPTCFLVQKSTNVVFDTRLGNSQKTLNFSLSLSFAFCSFVICLVFSVSNFLSASEKKTTFFFWILQNY